MSECPVICLGCKKEQVVRLRKGVKIGTTKCVQCGEKKLYRKWNYDNYIGKVARARIRL